VASPPPEAARDVFEARRTIEIAVVRNAVERLDATQLATLRALTDREAATRRSGKRHEAIRLSGEFHVRLAEFAGNPILLKFVEELVARSSLIIGLFGSLRLSSCSEDEHRALIDAIGARQAAAAVRLMVQHLDHIEGELDLAGTSDQPVDLGSILGARLNAADRDSGLSRPAGPLEHRRPRGSRARAG
jgi:DNA-binding GntR family transcriptional regulator